MENNMSKQEYDQYVQEKSPKSPIVKNCIWAFVVGGIICVIGQIVLTLLKNSGLNEEDSSAWTSIIMVFLSVLLTGLNIYPKIAKHAGAGTIVPITGFANAVTAPAIEAKTEGLVLGVGAKIFTIAGPVILYGVTASVIAGIIKWIFKI